MKKFKWRKNPVLVNQIFQWSINAGATDHEGTRQRYIGKIEGAIFSVTRKKCCVGSMADICEALGIPYAYDEKVDIIYWGEKAGICQNPTRVFDPDGEFEKTKEASCG